MSCKLLSQGGVIKQPDSRISEVARLIGNEGMFT